MSRSVVAYNRNYEFNCGVNCRKSYDNPLELQILIAVSADTLFSSTTRTWRTAG